MAAIGPGVLPGAPPLTVHQNYEDYFNDADNDPFLGNYANYMAEFAVEPYNAAPGQPAVVAQLVCNLVQGSGTN